MKVYEAIIFDLDQTLIDTSALKKWRDERSWDECYNHLQLTSIYPHVQSLLQSLIVKKIAVVTNSPHVYASKLLEYHQIPYDHLVAYQKHGRNKPYPDQLMSCIEELKVEPAQCMYIGDDPNDIVAAKIAGFHAVGFCFGNLGLAEMIFHMPDGIVSNYHQLFHYVQKQDDVFFQDKLKGLYDHAMSAQQARDGKRYVKLLKDASNLGHGQAQYKLSKLLEKNPALVDREKDSDYYLWEAAKLMVAEAIYEIGYRYEIDNQTELAEPFLRTSANLGLPHAQFFFGKTKLKANDSSAKANVSHRWMKKSVTSGLEKGQSMLEQVSRIVAFEADLDNRLFFERGTSIYYLDSYLPEQRFEDFFSQEIIKIKDKEESGILYFLEQLESLLLKDIAICYVPSSDKENLDSGIRKIAQRLSTKQAIDATNCLVRYQSKEKSSLGGDRSIEAHMNTMLVENKGKIVGKHVLLLDDITTSGSALIASEQLLMQAGALHVTKLALGRTKS
nr:HAD-IA family hydrolase [Aquibacillus halophilus]